MHNASDALHKSPNIASPTACRLVQIGEWSAPRGRDFPTHRHTVWEIVYYREGHIRCPVGNRVYTGQPGVILATPPGVYHSKQATTAYANFYAQIEAPADSPWPVLCHDDASQTWSVLFRSLLREAQTRAEHREQLIGLLLAQLDILLQRASRAQSEDSEPEAERIVRHAERIMEEKGTGPLRVSEIARTVGVSESTLRAHFALCRGHAPGTHLRDVRVRRAVALLCTSNLTLDAIAALCGYDSASHLSRYVKRYTGSAPGMLRGS